MAELGRVKVGQLCPHSVIYLLCNMSVLERDLKLSLTDGLKCYTKS